MNTNNVSNEQVRKAHDLREQIIAENFPPHVSDEQIRKAHDLREKLIAENYIRKISSQGAKFYVRREFGDFKVVPVQKDPRSIADYLIKSEKFGREIFVHTPSTGFQRVSFSKKKR